MTSGRRQLLLVLLALNSGAIDATGYVALGGAFTSVMTGNMILLGVSAAKGDGALALRSVLAIVTFALGCYVGARIARTPQPEDPLWPRPVSRAMTMEMAAVAVFSVTWWALGNHPTGDWQLFLLAVDAIALGIQSSAILRFGVSGLSTTYLTGTLTTLVSALANGRHPRNVLPSAEILVSLMAGAGLAAVLARHTPVLVPLISLVTVGGSIAAAHLPGREHPPSLDVREG